ncbi:MAG: hypothetical protein ACYC2U_04715 [Candidatus Amoebophilus sp.]
MRKSDTSAITLITEDGIRWTSAKLIEIANSAIAQTYRMIEVYSKSPVIQHLAPVVGSVSQVGSVSFSSGVASLPSNASFILEVIDASNNSYAYIPPEQYLLYKNIGRQPLSEGFFFTILTDASNVEAPVRKIYTLPASSFTGTITYIFARTDYDNTKSASILALTNMDDLLLDVAEREARDREGNLDRSKVLDVRIMMKLGINIGGQ